MHERMWIRSSKSPSDNRKSKIQSRKWVGIFAIAFTFTIGGAVVQAQQPKKIARIGYLSVLSSTSDATRLEAFRQGLRELGYVEGQNLAVEPRYAEGKLDRLPDLAGELVRLNVDVIVAGGSTAIRATRMPPS